MKRAGRLSPVASITDIEKMQPWRDAYRAEMNCQIIHDSIHYRSGWTQEYSLKIEGEEAGYGSVAVAGPWKEHPAVYEFYVTPRCRIYAFDLFEGLLDASGAAAIEVQTNDVLITTMLHVFGRDVRSESILFEDGVATALDLPGARFRVATEADMPDVAGDQLKWHGVVEIDGNAAGKGGILFHYNRPYGDIFMEVDEAFRRRGVGSFLVQELKRVCYEGGHIPSARCRTDNTASRRTLQKAGFVPCGHILIGETQSKA